MENRKSVLPEAFFARGLARKSRQLLDIAEADMNKGALDQASEALARGMKINAQLLVMSPSSYLTEQENSDYLQLKRFRYLVTPTGSTLIREFTNERTEARFQLLDRKALGLDK